MIIDPVVYFVDPELAFLLDLKESAEYLIDLAVHLADSPEAFVAEYFAPAAVFPAVGNFAQAVVDSFVAAVGIAVDSLDLPFFLLPKVLQRSTIRHHSSQMVNSPP